MMRGGGYSVNENSAFQLFIFLFHLHFGIHCTSKTKNWVVIKLELSNHYHEEKLTVITFFIKKNKVNLTFGIKLSILLWKPHT